MKPLRWPSHTPAQWAVILLLLTLAACGGVPLAPSVSTDGTQAALLAQAGNAGDNQAAATAEVQRAHAQATLSAAVSTVSAAQTQDQSAANVIAVHVAATAEIERANAQATLASADSTQSAALAQDAIRQRQVADQATAAAQAVLVQQNADDMAAGTQTAVAEGIATEAGSAAATSQWYTEQGRQRDAQRQVPITFLLTWCWPAFLVLVAGLAVWGLWRWLRLRQTKQRMFNELLEELPAPPTMATPPPAPDNPPYTEGDPAGNGYELTEPEDQVQRWLGEVKDKLQGTDEKDQDDDTNH